MARAADAGRYVVCEVYGSHWERAYFARGIENLMSDMAGDRAWARDFLAGIVDRNLVMLDNVLATPGIDAVLLGSDWGCQRGMLMSPKLRWAGNTGAPEDPHWKRRDPPRRRYAMVRGRSSFPWSLPATTSGALRAASDRR